MSVNKVFLLGNVGKDPQVREVSGVKVASFTLATTDRGYTKSTGEQVPERTEWHNITVWRGLAEIAERYIRKGTRLHIIGKLTTRTYEKDGIKRYSTEIIADDIELLGGGQQSQQAQAPQPQPQPQYQQQAYQQPAPQAAPLPSAQPAYQQPQQYQQQQYYQPQQQQSNYRQAPGVDDLPY